ncbi:MAG: hypothetical protein KA264_11545 [Crocinitomicaceae bacterium]|nr:hypothetical protein [Crocinitomicaceae bacterium]MBP6460715.1 hypothetical protein [Crocinitomicaceae bacterium]
MRIILSIAIGLSVFYFQAQENIALITPMDGDTIKTKNPLLSWTYMRKHQQQNDRSFYRLVLVELNKEQSAEAGVLMNQPLLKMEKIQSTQVFYPYDAPELKEGVWYAWQVQHFSNNTLIDKSEAWKFILPLPIIPIQQYYKMKVKPDGTEYLAQNGLIQFEFNEHYKNDEKLSFFLYNDRNQLIPMEIAFDRPNEQTTSRVNIKRNGLNFYTLDLGEHATQGRYKLLLLDAKKQQFELIFRVK